jgi:hypothetical protein
MPYQLSAQRAAALAVLGLPEQATGEQITRAYRRLAKATHPDTTGRSGPEAGQTFAAVSQAYRRLRPDPAPEDPREAPEPPTPPTPVHRRASEQPPIVAGPVVFTPTNARTRGRA